MEGKVIEPVTESIQLYSGLVIFLLGDNGSVVLFGLFLMVLSTVTTIYRRYRNNSYRRDK